MTLQLLRPRLLLYLYQVSGVRPNPSCPCDVPDNVGSKYYKFIDPKIRAVVVRSRCRWFWRSCFRDLYFCFLFFPLVSVVHRCPETLPYFQPRGRTPRLPTVSPRDMSDGVTSSSNVFSPARVAKLVNK